MCVRGVSGHFLANFFRMNYCNFGCYEDLKKYDLKVGSCSNSEN